MASFILWLFSCQSHAQDIGGLPPLTEPEPAKSVLTPAAEYHGEYPGWEYDPNTKRYTRLPNELQRKGGEPRSSQFVPDREPPTGATQAPGRFQQKVLSYEQYPVQVKRCVNGYCWYETQYQWRQVYKTVTVDLNKKVPVEAAPTPLRDVREILAILSPQKHETLVDYGCGDARYLIEAAKTYGCKCVGIDIDEHQAAKSQYLVDQSGYGHLITIVHGDSTKLQVEADVGVAYLYTDVLRQLVPKIKKLKRFASFMHDVPGLNTRKEGSAYFWEPSQQTDEQEWEAYVPQPRQQMRYYQPQQRVAYYGGRVYTGPCCNDPRCGMRHNIMRQLGY